MPDEAVEIVDQDLYHDETGYVILPKKEWPRAYLDAAAPVIHYIEKGCWHVPHRGGRPRWNILEPL